MSIARNGVSGLVLRAATIAIVALMFGYAPGADPLTNAPIGASPASQAAPDLSKS